MQITIPANGWTPRPHQRGVWADLEREVPNLLVIAHRRFGKGELMLHDCAVRAAKRAANYFYMLPETEHVRKAIWTALNPGTGRRRIDEAFPLGFRVGPPKEQDMVVTVYSSPPRNRVALNEPGSIQHYHSTVQFTGSDNYETLRGGSGLGYYFDEWAWADPQALAILRPIVAENGGFFRFLTTSFGKNHAYKMLVENRRKPDWAVHLLPNSQTKIFTPEQIRTFLEENIDLYGPEVGRSLTDQEYECSFEEIVPGSFYLDLLLKAEREQRLTALGPSIERPVFAAFDLGFTDATAIWYVQIREDNWVDVIGYDEFTKMSIPEIIPEMRKRPGYYAALLLPHDGAHHEVTSGTTTEQLLTRAGFSCHIMPQTDDGAQIQSVRMLLPRCRFNLPACERGLACLRHFHNKAKHEGGKTSWSPKPVHDWSSHAAKAFATLAYFAPSLRANTGAQGIEVRDIFSSNSQRAMQGSGWMR
jgi:hypothetical protein